MKTSKRFTSEKNANGFAKKVGGVVSDLRNNENRKSDFKVTYEKGKSNPTYIGEDESDFDSDINMNGMHWHTSEDL